MDLATVFGLLLAWGSVVSLVYIEGGHLSSLWNLGAFILVVGGTIGVTIVGQSKEDILNLPNVAKNAFFSKAINLDDTIGMLVELSRTVRKEGLLSLERVSENIKNEFFKKAIQIVVDGLDAEQVRLILETDLELLEERHKGGQKIFVTMGGFGPTLGIIGTVLGLVHMLANISSPDTMGPAIAAAFIATLYGVGSANLVYIPIGNKLKRVSEEEVLERRIILEGIISIQGGGQSQNIGRKTSQFSAAQAARAGSGKS